MNTWEREFFHLAGSVLASREAALDFHEHQGLLPDGGRYDPIAIFVGELTYRAEMHFVLREAGMLPAQRLARCAGRLLNGRNEARQGAGRDLLELWDRRYTGLPSIGARPRGSS